MSRYRKIASIIIMIEIVCIFSCNVLYFVNEKDNDGRLYRVEAQRAALELQEHAPTDIDLSLYETIVDISLFEADEVCNHDYVVEKVNGVLYRIEYQDIGNNSNLWLVNICMLIMLLVTIFVLMYIWRRVLKPFHNMSELTYELAKGNLSVPVKAEKNKFFGKFLWGMDMLRENLEDGRQKELELQKEKKTLILSLSHDIKTPLSAIDLYTKALSENLYDTGEKKTEVLQGISKNVQEIKDYVEKIVSASREDFLNLDVINGEFYLVKIMSEIEAYYKDKLSVIHTEFIVEDMENCLLLGDADRVIEVLQNVMENAIKYGDEKQIQISVSEEEDCKLINIENTGCTLKQEEVANIFDSFYRGSNSKNIKGSGLGLYIAKSLMRKMDGEIFAKIVEQKFRVSIVIRKA